MNASQPLKLLILFSLILCLQGRSMESPLVSAKLANEMDSPIERNVTITSTACGEETGAIAIEITSGSGDYSVIFGGTQVDLDGNIFDTTLLAAGSYAVTLIDNVSGCEDNFLPSVSSDGTPPDPEIAPSTASCSYEADLNGQVGAGALQWTASGPGSVTFDDPTIEDPHVTVSVGGNYTFYLQETTLGCSGLDSISFSIGPPETVTGGNDTTVCSLSTSLLGSATNGAWAWTSPGDQIAFTPSPSVHNPSATAPSYGIYTLFWTFTDDNSCAVSGDLEIDFREQPVAESTDVLNFCQLFDNTLEAVAPPPGILGTWSIPSGNFNFNPLLANTSIQNNGTFGTYQAIWTLTNSPFCTDSDITQLIYTAPEEANIEGFDIQLCGNSQAISATNENGTWSSPDPQLSFTDPNSNNTDMMASAPGNFTLEWTVGTGDCETSDDRTVVAYQSASVVITTTETEVCTNGSISLEATAENGISLEWTSTGDGTFTSFNTTSTVYSPGPLDSSSGSVTLTLSNEGDGTCPTVSDDITIDVLAGPTVMLPTSNTTICSSSAISINGMAENVSGLTWTTSGDGTYSPSNSDPLIAYTPGTNDALNGSVILTLTGSPQSPLCSPAFASATINLVPPPNPGPNTDLTLCETGSNFDLNDAIDPSADTGGNFTDLDGSGALTGDIFNPVAAGVGFFEVSYEVEGASPCSDASSIITIEVTEGPNAGTDVANTVCLTAAALNLSTYLPLDSDPGGSWAPHPFLIGSTFDQATAGTGEYSFQYIVEGSNGCVPDTCNLMLTVTDGPDAGEDGSITACSSSTSIDLYDGLDGTPDPGGTWDDLSGTGALNGGTFDASQNGSGTYSFEYIVDLPDCQAATSLVTVTVTEGPNVNIIADSDSSCGVDTIFVSAEVSNVNSILWTSSGTGLYDSADGIDNYYVPSQSDLSNGSVDIILTGTGSPSCEDAVQTLTVELVTYPDAHAGPDDATCGLEYLLMANPSEGSGIWSGLPGIADSGNPNTSIDVTTPGAYTLTWTEDNQGCISSDEVELEFLSSPSVTSVVEVCVNTGIEFEVVIEIDGGDASSYEFSVNGDLIGNEFTSETFPTGSNYAIEVWDANQCDTFIVESSFTCPVLTDPGTLDTTPLVYCIGEEVLPTYNENAFLDANDILLFILHDADPGPGTILDTSDQPAFSFLSGMLPNVTYYISAVAGDDIGGGEIDFSASNTVFSAPVPVTFNAVPEITLSSADVHFCEGDSAQLQISLVGSPNFEILYNLDGVETQITLEESNTIIYVDQSGVLTIDSISDLNCGTSVNQSVAIIAEEIPSAILVDTVTFCSASVEAIPIELTGTAPWSYTLLFEGSTLGNQSSSTAQTNFTPENTGTYSITNLANEYCETDSVYDIEVTINPSPLAVGGPDVVVCTGDSVHIGGLAQLDTEYSWSNAFNLVSPLESSTAMIIPSPSSTTLDFVFVLTAELMECITTDTVEVTINPLPQDVGIDSAEGVCIGDSIPLTAFGGVNYVWEASEFISDPLSATVYVNPEEEETFVVEIFNSFGCSTMDSTHIIIYQLPEIQTSPLVANPCIPANVLWANSEVEGLLDCEWTFENTVINSQDCGLVDLTMEEAGLYSGSLTVTSLEGCTNAMLTDTIEIFSAEAQFNFSPNVPSIDDTLVSVYDLSFNSMTQFWTIDGDSAGIGPEAIVSFGGLRPGYYELCLIMTSVENCVDTTCKKVELDNPVGIYVPNTFTPDGDGLNDEFAAVISGQEYLQFFELSVFDRKGRVQFRTSNPNESWDGINKRDNTIAQGLYEWVLEIGVFGEAYPRRYLGTITVLK